MVGRNHGIIREDHGTQVGTLTMIGIRGGRIIVGQKSKRGERDPREDAKESIRPEAQEIRGIIDSGMEDQSQGCRRIRGGEAIVSPGITSRGGDDNKALRPEVR